MKTLAAQLSRRGPHKVLRGDLAVAGQPGVVYTPESGLGLPAVAFAHGWMSRVENYVDLLEHLASWGIVAVAPNTERGPVPNHRGLAADLGAALDTCLAVRLGDGRISISKDRLGLVGDGMGAGVAVITAAARSDIKAIAALFPAPTSPAAEDIAHSITASGLVIAGSIDVDSAHSVARKLAFEWDGPVVARTLKKASASGLAKRGWALRKVGIGTKEPKTRKLTNALITGFFLHELAGDKTYRDFSTEASISGTTVMPTDTDKPPAPGRIERIKQLVGR